MHHSLQRANGDFAVEACELFGSWWELWDPEDSNVPLWLRQWDEGSREWRGSERQCGNKLDPWTWFSWLLFVGCGWNMEV